VIKTTVDKESGAGETDDAGGRNQDICQLSQESVGRGKKRIGEVKLEGEVEGKTGYRYRYSWAYLVSSGSKELLRVV